MDNDGSRAACWETTLEVLVRDHGHLEKDAGSGDGKSRSNSIDILEAKITGISERLDMEDDGKKKKKQTLHPSSFWIRRD